MLAELESRSCVRTIRPRPADLVTGLPEDVATARNEPARAGEAAGGATTEVTTGAAAGSSDGGGGSCHCYPFRC